METRIENTAPEIVTQTAAKLIRYQTLLALLDTLHERSEIDEKVHDTACRLIAMKCGLNQTSIFI